MLSAILSKVDWEDWAALLTVVGVIGSFSWVIAKRFLVTREEFQQLQTLITRYAGNINNNHRDIKALKEERKSFRQEVLEKMGNLEEKVDNLISFLLEKK